PTRSRAPSLTQSNNQPTWKSTRSSFGPRRRTSNTEVDYAPFLAGFSCGADDFHDARNISTAGPRPAKGTSRETPDFLSHDTGRWTLHLLQRGRAERRAKSFAIARASFLIPNVRTPVLSAFRTLSPYRARLPRLRTQ